eukprot:TRINITY_DN9185_c0_g2_i1.p1 TRINITY_DN9185_c0_g2~~TRINITY_DN9185_c0_g2_i1.p1  ORF type:complete len:148 (-),score=49.90 TRINITY_DN9185_c0_g2_i1:5-448(-)
MDAIKKKMEKLSSETADAERRISMFEEIKAVNEQEAEKFEEQLRIIQKKIQNMESAYDVCIEDLFNQTVKLEGMEKKAGNAESEVSALRGRLILLQENNENKKIGLLNQLLNLLVLVSELMEQLESELSWRMVYLLTRNLLTTLISN